MRLLNRWYPAGEFGSGDAQGFNQQFEEMFLDMVDIMRKRRSFYFDEDELGNFLKAMAEVGAAAYNTRFGAEIQQALRTLEQEHRDRGLSLTLVFPNALSVFWEAIYVDPYNDHVNADPKAFWGLRHPVARSHWGPQPHDEVHLNQGALFIRDEDLRHSQYEFDNLQSWLSELSEQLGAHLEVADPTAMLPDEQVSSALLDLIRDATFNYGIVHFACHIAAQPGGDAAQSYLRFTHNHRQWKVTLRKLQALSATERGPKSHPLVFLNACASSTQGYLDQMISFPVGFLNFGVGGVLATACPIPDSFANAFATEFYQRLLSRQHLTEDRFESDVATALLETRWHFLEEYNNPLGLVYGFYGMSKQKLVKKREVQIGDTVSLTVPAQSRHG